MNALALYHEHIKSNTIFMINTQNCVAFVLSLLRHFRLAENLTQSILTFYWSTNQIQKVFCNNICKNVRNFKGLAHERMRMMRNFKVVAIWSKYHILSRDMFDPDHICKEELLTQLISSATFIWNDCYLSHWCSVDILKSWADINTFVHNAKLAVMEGWVW